MAIGDSTAASAEVRPISNQENLGEEDQPRAVMMVNIDVETDQQPNEVRRINTSNDDMLRR